MRFVSLTLAIAVAASFTVGAHAQMPPAPGGQTGNYAEGVLPLENGQSIKDFFDLVRNLRHAKCREV